MDVVVAVAEVVGLVLVGATEIAGILAGVTVEVVVGVVEVVEVVEVVVGAV